LGCGGYLGSLVRLSSGRFRLEEAVSLERLEEAFEYGEGERYLMPLDEALLDWPAVVVGAEDAQRILHGQAVAVPPAAAGDERRARVYSLEGDFLAIATYDVPTQEWRPKKVFSG
jgi:tRNA pseudouridine55 synthase